MSIFNWKNKVLGHTFQTGGGGSSGGGSPAPTQTSVTNTNIPEYAQPYVETMLGTAQQQIFNYDDSGNVVSMKPYTPYSSTATDYIAGFSPLQQQAQSNIANMQTPGSYATGQDFATTAGMGALSTANTAAQYGGLGANYGGASASMAPQAQQYGQTASDIGMVGGLGYGAQGSQAGQTAASIGTLGGMQYGTQGSQTAEQNARLSNLYGAAGAGTGQQAAGQSSVYGGMGTAIGAQAAGQSSMYGGMGTATGAQAAGMSNMLGMGAVGQGQQGANIGASLGQQSTNPSAVSAYMNPYIQNALAPALALQEQEFGIKNMQNQAQATQQGAFGGGRSAVMQGLNQQNQALAQNQLVGNAYNQAFQNAQTQMNTANQAALSGNAQAQTGFGQGLQGANQAGQLGMAGTAQGLQGANQAGQLGISGANVGLAGVNAGIAGQNAAMQGSQIGLSGVNAAMQGQQAGLQGLSTANQLYGQGIAGANAGLQGTAAQQAAYQQLGAQGANMANIAGQETQTGLNIAQAQQAAGAAQQAQQQNIINQQIQNYATAQQYPMTQLSNMSSLLRGLPMQATTTQSYQAAPSSVSTLAGLGTAGLGAYKMATAAQGGSTRDIVKMASGGIASGVPAQKLDSMLGRLDDKQLANKSDPRMNDPQTAQAALSQQAFRSQMRPAGIGQNYNFQAAGGGIVAFAEGDVVKDDSSIKSLLMQEYQTPMEEALAKQKAMQPKTDFATKYGDMLAQAGLTTEADTKSSQGLRLLQAGMGALGGASPFAGVNIGQGVQPAIAGYAQDVKEQKAAKMDLAKQQFDLGKFGYSNEADLLKAYREDRKGTRDNLVKMGLSDDEIKARIKAAEIGASASKYAADAASTRAGIEKREGIQTVFESLVAQGYDPKSPITKDMAQQQYNAQTRPYGASSMMSAFAGILAKDGQIKTLNQELSIANLSGDSKKVEDVKAKIATRTTELQTEFQNQVSTMKPGGAGVGGAQPVVNPNTPSNVQVPPLPPGFKPV
jgi:hypothetical protein